MIEFAARLYLALMWTLILVLAVAIFVVFYPIVWLFSFDR